jgi:DNA-binding CsgD family transcriptional regulator
VKHGTRTTIAAVGAALALAAGAGGALAAAQGGPGSRPGPAAVAAYLGLTPAQLAAQLAAGKSLAQIATAQGKSVSGLEDVIYAAAKARADKAVAAGKLTAAQEQKLLAALKSRLDAIVNRTGLLRGHHGRAIKPIGAAVASYLGLSRAELLTQLRSGKSLAQIAGAQGKTVSGLKTAILNAAKSRLDRAVAAGRLTAAQEKNLLAKLQARLDRLVNRTVPARG